MSDLRDVPSRLAAFYRALSEMGHAVQNVTAAQAVFDEPGS